MTERPATAASVMKIGKNMTERPGAAVSVKKTGKNMTERPATAASVKKTGKNMTERRAPPRRDALSTFSVTKTAETVAERVSITPEYLYLVS